MATNHDKTIHLAVSNARIDIVQMLLNRMANFEALNKDFETALTLAIEKNDAEMVELLLDSGANPNVVATNPIHPAVSKAKIDILELLLNRMANFEAPNKSLESPLQIAVTKNNLEMVELLLASSARMKTKSYGNWMPLGYALKLKHADIVRKCSDGGHDINYKDVHGATALHKAVEGYFLTVLKVILKSGADIEAKDKNGKTPLLWTDFQFKLSRCTRRTLRNTHIRL